MTASNLRVKVAATLLTTLLVLSSFVGAGLGLAPAAAEPEADELATIKVLDVTPTTVGPDDEVTVEIELTNPTTKPLKEVDLTLSVVRYNISSDAILDNWFTGVEPLVAPVDMDTVSLDQPLAPGKARKFTLKTPAADLRLLPFPDAAGPRGLIIKATDPSTRAELDLVRTFLLWYPNDDVEPLRLAILTPVTGPPPTPSDPDNWGQEIAEVTATDGRLNALLKLTSAYRDISWVVDPALVNAAATGTAGDSGTIWAEEFSRAAKGRDVFSLPPFDPDVAALATTGINVPGVDTVFSPATGWREDLTLPATATTDEVGLATLQDAVEAHRPLVVLNQGLLPLADSEPILNAAATVPTAAGPATALLPNAELSRLFAHPSTSGLRSTAESRQLLLARLAIIAQADPQAPQHVLLSTDRYWSPEVAEVKVMLDGIFDARFIETDPLSRLLGSRIQEVAAESVPAEVEPSPMQVTAAELSNVLDQRNQINTLAQAVADPDALTAEFRTNLTAVTSSAWRNDVKGRTAAIEALSEYADKLLSGVTIVPGSDLNLISDRGDLPVTISNSLDQDLNVQVALVPNDQRLRVKESVAVTIPEQSAATVDIPATAIGSGDVSVEVQILTPEGDLVAIPSHFNVRVRADWENVGTAVLAGVLAIALAFGIIRTIKRGKRPTRMEPIHPPSNPESTS